MPLASSHRAVSTISVVGVAVATLYAGFVAWSANWMPYAGWSAFLFIPLILFGNAFLLVRAGRRDPDPRFIQLLVLAFVAKMVATVARYLMAFVLYGGVSDAKGYDGNGARLALAYRQADFGADIGREFIGTGFMRVATGVLYTLTGRSIFVAFLVFSIFSFWGLYFLYRAFRVSFPSADARRYALLLFFLPSMIFWPSSLGKEAWMTLGIGLVAYGIALLLLADRRCVMPLVIGMAMIAVVRPHIGMALFAALSIAYLLGPARRPSSLTPFARGLAALVLAGAGLFFITHTATFLGVESVSVDSVDKAVSDTAELTDEGDSGFKPQPVKSVTDFPVATLTVLFRPFPFEASNPQMLLAAAEGSLLLLLVAKSWRRVRTGIVRIRRQPYLLACAVYCVLFIYAFSSFSNFGILTRERVMVLPFFLVFLALPEAAHTPKRTATRTHLGVPA